MAIELNNPYAETIEGEAYIIDRSNPHQIVSICPPNNPNFPEFPEGFQHSRIQDMRFRGNKHGVWFGRRDILRIRLVQKSKDGRQERVIVDCFLDAYIDGTIDTFAHPEAIPYITDNMRKEVKAVVDRIIESAKEYPEMLYLLKKK